MALYGIDISTWQSVGTGDGDYDFVICKATGSDAGNYVDTKCDQHYQRAKAQGKLLGVYHFANPNAGSAESQAQFFVDNIRGYIGEAILVLDWEYGDTSNVAWAKAWLDKVYALTGVKPLIYMSGSVANSHDWSSVVKEDMGLWIAFWSDKYNVPNPGIPSPDEMTYPIGVWPFWAIWQYSSSAGRLDMDVANMTREGWMKYAAKNGQPKPAPTPTPAPAPEPKPSYIEYTVQPGDSLSKIAAEYGTTWQKIYDDNKSVIGGDPNRIYAGQVLKIYTSGSAPAPSGTTYTVQPGDNLSSIAAKYGTTWQKIYNDNKSVIGGDPNFITPGMVLTIN